MLDSTKRAELIEKLRNKVKQASANVRTKVEAERGDYKIEITASDISQIYKGRPVAKIKVAELDNDSIQLINSDAQDAAHVILDEFIASFDPKMDTVKEAANSALNEQTLDKITQKQLDDDKTKLHPRTNEYPNHVTQKQIPEKGQRPGTYEITTEGQLRDERTTFYGDERTSGDWKNEDRNMVTESQLGEAEDMASERGKSGSKFDGDLENQWHMTGEKQLAELLKHHKWEVPLTVTEGADQLGQQDGELSRLTAEAARSIIKEALEAFGKTVISAGITPADLAKTAKKLVSDESKYPVLADVLKRYAKADVSMINKKVAKAQHFGKTANAGREWSEYVVADVLVRQLAKIAHNPQHVVEGLVALSEYANFVEKIDAASNQVLTNTLKQKESGNSIFKEVLAGKDSQNQPNDSVDISGTAEDGMYAYAGGVTEVDADPNDQKKFAAAAAKYAEQKIKEHVGSTIPLSPQTIDVNTDKGVFEIQFKDRRKIDSELTARAERRRQLAKQAQKQAQKTAQVGGGGPMPPAGGGAMSNPSLPPTGGDMGAPPPGEALSQEPSLPTEPETGGNGEPKPPGSYCAACGGEDVNVDNGEWRCNNCGAEGDIHVMINVTKWPTVLEDSETEDKEGFDIEEEKGLEPDSGAMGSGTTLPNVPVAASFRLTHRMLEKLASQKIALGHVCPNCGSNSTDIAASNSHKGQDGVCWDCLQEYNFQVKTVKAQQGQKRNVYGQYVWLPTREAECSSCNRVKKAFLQSLKDYGMSWDEFDGLGSILAKSEVILKMSNAGTLNLSNSSNVPLNKLAASNRWKEYEEFDRFPLNSCTERLSRRFGENATSMSGPCQGKKLAECVCGQLKSLGIYSDGLAAKVASVQSNPDPTINSPLKTCVAGLVRDHGMDVDNACTTCDALRAAYASAEELAIEAIAQVTPSIKPLSKPMPVGKSSNPMANPAKMKQSKPAEMETDPMDKPVELQTIIEDMSPVNNDHSDTGAGMGACCPHDNAVPNADDMDADTDIMIRGDLDDFADQDILGLGDESITIKLPSEALESIKVLLNALQGQLDDTSVDTTNDIVPLDTQTEEDSVLDVGDITDNTVDQSTDDGENNPDTESFSDSEEDSESETSITELDESLPGSDDSDDSDDDATSFEDIESEQESNEDEEYSDEEEEDSEEAKDTVMKHTEKQPQESNEKEASIDSLLMSMKTGTAKTYNDSVNSLFEGLMRQAKLAAKKDDIAKVEYKPAEKGTKVKASPAQDSKEIGKYQNGGKMGNEESFSTGVKTKPDVPRGDALMGDEGKELTISESEDLPTVPNGSKPMDGEKNYKPEKGNVVDGNQGKHAASNSNIKTATVWNVPVGNKYYKTFLKQAQTGQAQVTLTDGKTYDIQMDQNKNIVLIASHTTRHCDVCGKLKPEGSVCPKCDNDPEKKSSKKQCLSSTDNKSDKIKKESQTVTLKNVKTLVDDPDLNQSSGPGKGKTHEDKTHSLGVDEKKPSEGVSDPSVPEAPNDGRLSREHTVEKPKDGPSIPAGGGMNPDYDKDEKNEPEKLDETLGKMNDSSRTANQDEAVKIAGQLLKAHMITIDELPNKVKELSKATNEILDDYKKLIAQTNETKGMRRTASAGSIETPIVLRGSETNDTKSELKTSIQSLFKLDKQNQDHEKFVEENGNNKLWH